MFHGPDEDQEPPVGPVEKLLALAFVTAFIGVIVVSALRVVGR